MVKKKDKDEKKEENNEVKVEVKSGEESKKSSGEKSDLELAEEKIDELESKLEEAEDKYLRLFAEFDNFRKRTARQFEEMSQSGRAQIISQLLDVLDNFERALEAARQSKNHDSLLQGTELVYKNLQNILYKEGLKPIEAVGQPFDPDLHEALMQIESDEHEEGTVVQEMVKGYKLGDKVLRYAKVAVSRGRSEGQEESDG